MVQVVPPPGWKRSGSLEDSSGGQSDLGELSTASIPAVPSSTSLPSKKNPAAVVPPALPVRKPAAESTVSKPADSEPASPQSVTPQQTAEIATGADPTEIVAGEESSAGDFVDTFAVAGEPSRWSTIAARVRKDWLVLAGGLSAGVTLGAAAWLAVWLQTPAPETVAEAPPAAKQHASPTAANNNTDKNIAPPAKEPVTIASKGEEDTATSVSPPEALPDEIGANDKSAPPPSARQKDPEPDETTVPLADAPPADKPTPALRLEPIAANRPLGIGEATTSEPQLTESAATLTDGTADEPPADADESEPTDDMVDHGSPGEPPPVAAAQIEQRLGVSLPEVKFAGVPLAQFAAFIGDVAGVRVMFDDTSLKLADKSRKTPVSVRLSNTTALATLRAVSDKLGLTYTIEDGRIVIAAATR